MTLRDKVREMGPENINDRYYGGIARCPKDYDYLNVTDDFFHCPYLVVSEENCRKCWSREFKEEKQMKYKVGDKFLEEIEVIRVDENDTSFPYRVKTETVKAWRSEEALDTFRRPDDMTAPEAWEVARKICSTPSSGGFTNEELNEIFGTYNFEEVFSENTPQEAAAKIKEWEESKEIKVGDVVEFKDGTMSVVLSADSEDGTAFLFTENRCVEERNFEYLKKTGRHIDIEKLLSKIRGES